MGRWFGPTPISQVLAQLLARTLEAAPAASEPAGASVAASSAAPGPGAAATAAATHLGLGGDLGLSIHVAMDGSLYREQVQRVARQPEGSWRPVLVLLPLRLGLDTLNPSYVPCLCACLGLGLGLG